MSSYRQAKNNRDPHPGSYMPTCYLNMRYNGEEKKATEADDKAKMRSVTSHSNPDKEWEDYLDALAQMEEEVRLLPQPKPVVDPREEFMEKIAAERQVSGRYPITAQYPLSEINARKESWPNLLAHLPAQAPGMPPPPLRDHEPLSQYENLLAPYDWNKNTLLPPEWRAPILGSVIFPRSGPSPVIPRENGK